MSVLRDFFLTFPSQHLNINHLSIISHTYVLMHIPTAFALRPLERNPSSAAGNALEGAFRVYLTQREQKSLGLANGDIVKLKTSAGFKGYAVAWLASSPNPGNKAIAKVTDLLREQYGLSLNDPVFVEKATNARKPFKSIEVSCPQHKFASDEELLHCVRYALGRVHPRKYQ